MKRWKKYALCLTCILCVGMLAGCGNKNRTNTGTTEKKTETTEKNGTETGVTEKNTTNGTTTNNETTVTEDKTMTENQTGNVAGEKTTGQTERTDVVEEHTNVTETTETGTGRAGNAVEDIVDGVGNAGKDIVDGVENAGDSLTGTTEKHTER